MHLVKTTAADGLEFTGLLSESETFSKKRIVIHIHGMAGDPYTNQWYADFHRFYPERGIAFLSGQHRGTGTVTEFTTSSGKYVTIGDAFETFEESLLDIDAWVNYARGLGYSEIILQAHSFGPSKVLNYLKEKSAKDIFAAILISPVDMLGSALLESNYEKMLTEAKELVSAGKPRTILSLGLFGDCLLSAGTFLNVFVPGTSADVFCYTDRKNHDWSAARSVLIPLLLIGGDNDRAMEDIRHTRKCFDILRKELVQSPKVRTKVYAGASHSFSGFGEEIVREVTAFLN